MPNPTGQGLELRKKGERRGGRQPGSMNSLGRDLKEAPLDAAQEVVLHGPRILPLASPPPPARLFFLPDAAHAWREEVDGRPLRVLRSRTPVPAWARRAVGEGVMSCPRAGCGKSACPDRTLSAPSNFASRHDHSAPEKKKGARRRPISTGKARRRGNDRPPAAVESLGVVSRQRLRGASARARPTRRRAARSSRPSRREGR
jgi:hypothetical protein